MARVNTKGESEGFPGLLSLHLYTSNVSTPSMPIRRRCEVSENTPALTWDEYERHHDAG